MRRPLSHALELGRICLPQHLRADRALYVVGVLIIASLSTVLAILLSPSGPGRAMSAVFSVLTFFLLLAFIRGLSEHLTVYLAGCMGVAYLFLVSLTEGHLYSSTLAWLPLIPLAIFYVIHPRAGRLWMLFAGVLQVLMAALAWGWGDQLPPLNGPELPTMSFIDIFLATIVLFFVPNFYQSDLEHHLLERRAHQRDLRAKQVELEHTQQMQEHFIASVSHELRTPMNAILGLNAVLLERVQDKPQARKVLEYTRQSADHLMTVINDVLDHSQFSTGQISARVERFALHETVKAAFELFQPRVESTRLRYECEIAGDVPRWVETDRHRLMQVLVNLLGNAIKFTQHGSVKLRVVVSAGGLQFEVKDTGIGIAREQQEKIFERFGQADASIQKRYGGSGLGLTISQRLVKMLGGELRLESHEGAGSRFWFWLPLKAVQEPQAVRPQAQEERAAQQQELSFLVVDDHPVNRLLVRQVLMRHWPKAKVGRQALKHMQEQAFNLVLMDMVMPEMDGIEATAAIRASERGRTRSTPVLGLTANVSTADLQRFEAAGLDGVLLKPFEIERLCQMVHALVAQLPTPQGVQTK